MQYVDLPMHINLGSLHNFGGYVAKVPGEIKNDGKDRPYKPWSF